MTRSRESTEVGFTLVELLIVMVVLPAVVGAITVSLVSVFSLQTGVSNHLSNSADAQVVSALFVNDVQSASMITTASLSNPKCGTLNQLLGLESNLNPVTGVYQTDISYSADSGDALVRSVCTGGSTTPTGTTTLIVHNLPTGQGTASVSCATTTTLATSLSDGVSSGPSLNVSALPEAVSAGDPIVVGSGTNSQPYTAGPSGEVAGNVTIAVAPTGSNGKYPVSNGNYPVGTLVTDTNWSPSNLCATTNWISTAGVKGVTLHVQVNEATKVPDQHPSNYTYDLTAVPRTWTSASGGALPGGAPPLLLLGSSHVGLGNLPAELSCVGNGSIKVDGEAVLDDSTLNPAADVVGVGSISATSFYSVAGTPGGSPFLTAGGGQINSAEPPSSGYALADPYASLSPPATGLPILPGTPSPYEGFNVYPGPAYQGPGIYTSTLDLSGDTLAMASGVYILEGGMTDSGNGAVTSAPGGVLLYVTGGEVSLSGGASLNLSALSPPPSGLPSGLVLWQDKSDNLPILISGNVPAAFGGTVYAPGTVVGQLGLGTSAFSATSVMALGLACGGHGTIVIGFPVPTVTGISPTSGPKAGGTLVTVSGTGFVTGATVSFGGTNGSVVSVTSNSITVTSPRGSAGSTVDVTVTTPGGTSQDPTVPASADQFTYTNS